MKPENGAPVRMRRPRGDLKEPVNEELARHAGLEVPREKSDRPRPSAELYDVLDSAADYYQQQLKQNDEAVAYLKERGVSGEVARDFRIGFAPAG